MVKTYNHPSKTMVRDSVSKRVCEAQTVTENIRLTDNLKCCQVLLTVS